MKAYHYLEESYCNGCKILIAGNGGSAVDAEHIVGELMKEFENPRMLGETEVEKLKCVNAELGEVLGGIICRFITAYV